MWKKVQGVKVYVHEWIGKISAHMRKIRNNISATKDKGEKHIYLGWQFTFEPRKLFEMSDVSA